MTIFSQITTYPAMYIILTELVNYLGLTWIPVSPRLSHG